MIVRFAMYGGGNEDERAEMKDKIDGLIRGAIDVAVRVGLAREYEIGCDSWNIEPLTPGKDEKDQ